MKSPFQQTPGVAEILGIKVDLIDYQVAIASMEYAIRTKSQLTIAFVNVHSIMTAQKDAELRNAINNSSLSVSDGMPLVWVSKWTDTPLSERVYGPDLFKYFCELSQNRRYSHFFYGSSPLVLQKLKKKIGNQFPRINIVGSISPPYRPITTAEEDEYVEEINKRKPDVLWIGLGCPKQEKFMDRIRGRVEAPVIASIGAAFDFYAKEVRQAPKAWQRHGLEWLFRLFQEPRRLAFRYLVCNSLFIFKMGLRILRAKVS